jgi:hypothetical protein
MAGRIFAPYAVRVLWGAGELPAMKRRETKSLLVTGGFLLILIFLIGAGLSPGIPSPEPISGPELEHASPDAQFVQYLEYRAQLENSSNCQ